MRLLIFCLGMLDVRVHGFYSHSVESVCEDTSCQELWMGRCVDDGGSGMLSSPVSKFRSTDAGGS